MSIKNIPNKSNISIDAYNVAKSIDLDYDKLTIMSSKKVNLPSKIVYGPFTIINTLSLSTKGTVKDFGLYGTVEVYLNGSKDILKSEFKKSQVKITYGSMELITTLDNIPNYWDSYYNRELNLSMINDMWYVFCTYIVHVKFILKSFQRGIVFINGNSFIPSIKTYVEEFDL